MHHFSFPSFRELPIELRLQIWDDAVRDVAPRVVRLDTQLREHNSLCSQRMTAHPLLHASRESRAVALETFKLRLRSCSIGALQMPPLRGPGSAFETGSLYNLYLKEDDTLFIKGPNVFVSTDTCVVSTSICSLMTTLPTTTRATLDSTAGLEGYLALRSTREALTLPIFLLTWLFPNLRTITFEISKNTIVESHRQPRLIVDENQFDYVQMAQDDNSIRHLQDALELRYGAKLSAEDEHWIPPAIRFARFRT